MTCHQNIRLLDEARRIISVVLKNLKISKGGQCARSSNLGAVVPTQMKRWAANRNSSAVITLTVLFCILVLSVRKWMADLTTPSIDLPKRGVNLARQVCGELVGRFDNLNIDYSKRGFYLARQAQRVKKSRAPNKKTLKEEILMLCLDLSESFERYNKELSRQYLSNPED
ncbi:hypothetical protein RRG08_034571 [Elysia crispata]|uniref:Uncharacterized protein n=1 Tax=Elysia crispata TaxID=231223 RepID=A0AAE1B2J4_9GAST|nr:hypothetical protein RRG08_034571 [Elysia crispata]